MTIRDIAIAFGFEIDRNSESRVENSIQSLRNTATKLLGAIGVGFSMVAVNQLMEEFDGYNDQIQNATKNLGEQQDVQQRILEAANETKTSYGEMGNIISNLVQNDTTLFGSLDEAAEFAELSTKLFKTAGKSNEEIMSLQEAINKSFAKGIVDSETINQLYERAPEAINLISESLGVAREEILNMAADGTLALADLKNVFTDNADKINADYGNLAYSVSDALLNIRNKWGLFLDGLNKSVGITQSVSRIMVRSFDLVLVVLKRLQTWFERVTKAVGGFDNLLKLLAITLGAVFAVVAASKMDVLAFLDRIGGGLSKINLKLLGIVAVIVLLALLVEDFFRFMRGENSLIGSLFDKAGIGAENARQTIINVWNTVSGFLLSVWNGLKTAAQSVFGVMAAWWSENSEAVKASFLQIWNSIKTLCVTIWQGLASIAVSVFGGLQSFWRSWGDTIISIFGIIWNTLVSLIAPFLDALAAVISFLVDIFTGDWRGAWQAIKDFVSAIWEMIVAIISGAWDVICAIWSKFAEIFGGFFQAAYSAVSEKIAAIKDAIIGGLQVAIDWLKSLPEQAFKWGADIIEGIVSGIKGAANKVGEAVSGVASKIKSFLGFSKPEDGPLSDFDTYMPDMMDLMAQGIEAGKGKVANALKSLAADMSVLVKAKAAAPETAGRFGAGSSSSRVVTQNVNINNSFSGSDRMAQKQGAAAMKKSAGDATSQMARGLAYAR